MTSVRFFLWFAGTLRRHVTTVMKSLAGRARNPIKMKVNLNKPKHSRKNRKETTKLTRNLVSHVEPKYLDVLSVASNIGSGSSLFALSLVPSGDQQSQRVSDFIQPLRLLFNFSLYTVNSDIVTTVRLIFFRWIPSTALIAPVVASILEAPSAANVLSHFNFQLQDNYKILLERQFQASGITVAPTVNSNFGATGFGISLKDNPEIEFTLTATTGSNHLYLLAISDSAVTPFPILNFSTRLYYEDTIKLSGPNSMVR